LGTQLYGAVDFLAKASMQLRRLRDLITLLHGELLVLRLRTIVTFRSCAAVAFASGLHTFLEILLATVVALVVSAIALRDITI